MSMHALKSAHQALRCAFLSAMFCLSGSALAASCPEPLESLGGDNWKQISELSWKSEGHNFEPNQSFHPGAEGRHVSNDLLSGRWQPQAAAGQLDWQLSTHYPFAGVWNYQEIIGDKSRIEGRDGFRPSDEMTPARRHTRLVNMLQRFPALLFLHGNYEETENVCYVLVNHPTGQWRVWLNPTTGLPRRVVHKEQDALFGEVENSTAYEDWRQVEGLWLPLRLEQKVHNKLIRRERLYDFRFSTEPVAYDEAKTMARLNAEDVPEWAVNSANFFQRRAAAGAPMDTDPQGEIEFIEITPKIFQVAGGTHHSIVHVGRGSLVVVGAPWGERRSKAVIKALNERWPELPISHLILTHHHNDHSAGLMSFVEAGVSLVMGVPSRHYFGTVFAKSGRRNISSKTVADEYRLNAFGELIELYKVPNSHAEGMLAVYIRNDKTLITSDLYSPGRDAQHPIWSKELVDAIEWLNIDVKRVVGTHGRGDISFADMKENVEELQLSHQIAEED